MALHNQSAPLPRVNWATPMGEVVLLLGPSGVVGIADTFLLHPLTHDPCLATTHNHVQEL